MNALDVFWIDGQVEQVVAGVGGTPADAIHPEGDLLKGAAPNAEVGLGTPWAALAGVHTGNAFEQAVQGRLGRARDAFGIEDEEVPRLGVLGF